MIRPVALGAALALLPLTARHLDPGVAVDLESLWQELGDSMDAGQYSV
jgi:hypothetical protein